MRITYLTGGAGGMYCGSCIRDNALAAALTGRGHDVTLLPLYTPTRTDEENVSQHRLFFSGISVYLEQYVAVFRKTPWLLSLAALAHAAGRSESCKSQHRQMEVRKG